MFKTILLPVDLNHTKSWSKALEKAEGLARSFDSELHVLSIVPDFGMTIVRDYFPRDFEVKALQRAKSELEDFAEKNIKKDIRRKLHVGHGSVAEQILKSAKDIKADLIVMASHDPDRVREFLVGSNAERVVNHSPISVLVTRG
jgi:nucleotide-binding universal stress UspA family protein